MLIVSRRADEAIQINLAEGADGTLTLNDLFAKGPIEIMLLGSSGRRVKVGIAAPPELSIRRKDRDEAADGGAAEHATDQAPAGKAR
jgi:sRNA-binding carbon storage regulator CsrA